MTTKTRFIAGASCKKCAQIDVIKRTYGQQNGLEVDFIECVACGFTEGRPAAELQTAAENTELNDLVKPVKFKL